MTRGSLKLHKFVTIVADVMFTNNIPFLVTVYYSINVLTVGDVPTHTDKQLSEYFRRVMKIYHRVRMISHTVLVDTEFDKTINYLMDTVVINNSTSKENIHRYQR